MYLLYTGKFLSEALIFASTNPQYNDILFIGLQVQYVKIPSSEHGENILCTEIDFDIQNNLCTQHVLPMFCKNKSFWQRFTCILHYLNKCTQIVNKVFVKDPVFLTANWHNYIPTYTRGSTVAAGSLYLYTT